MGLEISIFKTAPMGLFQAILPTKFRASKIHPQPAAHSPAIHQGWEWTHPVGWQNGRFGHWVSLPSPRETDKRWLETSQAMELAEKIIIEIGRFFIWLDYSWLIAGKNIIYIYIYVYHYICIIEIMCVYIYKYIWIPMVDSPAMWFPEIDTWDRETDCCTMAMDWPHATAEWFSASAIMILNRKLVGGWATPLKNMTSSIGMIIATQY